MASQCFHLGWGPFQLDWHCSTCIATHCTFLYECWNVLWIYLFQSFIFFFLIIFMLCNILKIKVQKLHLLTEIIFENNWTLSYFKTISFLFLNLNSLIQFTCGLRLNGWMPLTPELCIISSPRWLTNVGLLRFRNSHIRFQLNT